MSANARRGVDGVRGGQAARAERSASAGAAERAFIDACRLDVEVRKPGNVSLASPGHGMLAAQFIASAQAAAPALCVPGATVGARIEAAVEASWRAVGCNTNLGIVLLCAPLAAARDAGCGARSDAAASGLRARLGQVLAALDVADAAAAFRAIARAQPAGLGQRGEHDVRRPPTITLRAAMALAAEHDSVARQYRDGFADLFDIGLPALGPASAMPDAQAVQRLYLRWLSGWPDSHIVRKQGADAAHSVMAAAQPWWRRAAAGEPVGDDAEFARWDAALKAQGRNPGTSADLTVATLMLSALLASAA